MTKRQRGGHPDRLKDTPLFGVQKGKQGNLPAVKKIDRIRMILGILRHAPAYNG